MNRLSVSLLLSFALAACSDDPVRDPDGGADAEVSPDVSPDVEPDVDASQEVVVPLSLDAPIPAGRVFVDVATAPSHLVQGPKAEGLLGDFVLANQRARFVVEGARHAGGYRMWGGHLVDVSIDGLPDLFGELWFAWNLEVFEPTEASIISNGDDGVAHVRISGRTGPYPWPDSFLRPILNPPPADLAVTYDYRLRPDEARIELSITLENDGADAVDLSFPLAAMNMGDGVKSYAADRGFGNVQSTSEMRWLGAIGPAASYAMTSSVPMSGVFSYANMDLVRFREALIPPSESLVIELAYVASTDGTPGIDALTQGAPDAVVSGTVAGPSAGAWVALTNASGVGALALVKDGAFEARVTPGTWSARAYAVGVAPSAEVAVTAPGEVALALPEPATLRVTIRDADSNTPIPAQLSLFREAGTDAPYAPPEVRIDRDWGAGRSQVVFAVTAETQVTVPAGHYRAVASRGYSYEITTVDLVLTAGEVRDVDVTIQRAVDTTGWSAADFHLHGTWSSDSDVPYDTRVRQAAVSDVALPVLTEHAYVGDLLTAAELAGVSDFVTPIPAQEVTTFEYGHFNAFPLVYDPDEVSGGAVFEHGHPGAELFDAIRAQQPNEVLIQVNHPRSASPLFAYFDYIGLDAVTGIAAKPTRATQNWDMIEVFNGVCNTSDQNKRARQDWIDLTNLGWKKVLSSGSDSHRESGGVGHPRSWVKVEQAAVAIDPQAIVAPLKGRQTFVSCGPFVRFATSGGAGMGELAAVDGDGIVMFAVTVEAPTWMAVDRIVLLENGVLIDSFEPADANRGADEARPAVRFDGVFAARPARDAWYAIEVLGSGSLAPIEFDDIPYALTNGIEIDVDGDGIWTPPGAVGVTP